MINLIVSVLAADVVGLGGLAVAAPLWLGVALAVVALVLNVVFLQRRAAMMWRDSERRFPARFPSTDAGHDHPGRPA